jgi:hypothetical protein
MFNWLRFESLQALNVIDEVTLLTASLSMFLGGLRESGHLFYFRAHPFKGSIRPFWSVR